MCRLLPLTLLAVSLCGLAGCATTSTPCVVNAVLLPENIVLDHTAAPPGNQTSYAIGYKAVQGSCGIPNVQRLATDLTTSDPVHVLIDNSNPQASVTCIGATDGPVSITSGTLTAQLTCH